MRSISLILACWLAIAAPLMANTPDRLLGMACGEEALAASDTTEPRESGTGADALGYAEPAFGPWAEGIPWYEGHVLSRSDPFWPAGGATLAESLYGPSDAALSPELPILMAENRTWRDPWLPWMGTRETTREVLRRYVEREKNTVWMREQIEKYEEWDRKRSAAVEAYERGTDRGSGE